MASPESGAEADASRPPVDRRRAAIAVAPFLAVVVGNVVLALRWSGEPLWGFVVAVPVLFVTAIAWFAFRAVPG